MSIVSRPITVGRYSQGAFAFLFYAVLSILYYGGPIRRGLSHYHVGFSGGDPAVFIWFIRWWPYAVSNRLNIFITKIAFYPSGFNLMWGTSVPAPAFLASPLTYLFGPVVGYNVVCLFIPVLAALGAFLLCRQVSRSFWPSLFGGYVFGFSPYLLGQMTGHLAQSLVFPVPIALYVFLLWLDREISAAFLTAVLAAVLTIQFLCWTEVFATATLFAAMAFVVAIIVGSPSLRRRLLRGVPLIGAAYCLAAICLSPFLYYTFAFGMPRGPINSPEMYSSDFLSFFFPSSLYLIGHQPVFTAVTTHFSAGAGEDTAYLSIPFILLLLAFLVTEWRRPRGKLMIVAFSVTIIATLGPRLHTAGIASILLPWSLCVHMPLLDKVLPCRLSLFLFLDMCIISAIFLSSGGQSAGKWVVAALIALSFVPNQQVTGEVDTPRFFVSGKYKDYIQPGDTTLILPYGEASNMLWQAQTDMYFRQAGGYLGLTPPEYLRWPVVKWLYNPTTGCLDCAEQLKAFLGAHNVKTIVLSKILDNDARSSWSGRLSRYLGVSPMRIDDVLLYRIPLGLLTSYKSSSAHEMVARAAGIGLSTLIRAADLYLAKGLPVERLSPWEAVRHGVLVLPETEEGENPSDPCRWQNLWLRPYGKSFVGIGTIGEFRDLREVAREYGAAAEQVLFPYPSELKPGYAVPDDASGQLLIIFSRKGLNQTANLITRTGSTAGLSR